MTSETSLKNFILGGIFLIPFVGLIVGSSFYFPFITPKNLVFRLIALIISALFAVVIYKGNRYRPSFGTIGWSFLIFIVIIFVADLFGQYAHKSFFSNFERMEGFFTLLLLFFYFTVLNGVMKTERLWINLMNTSIVSSIFMAIFALVEKSHGVERLAAQLGNSTYLGAFMLFNIFFSVFLIIRRLDKKDGDSESKWLSISAYIFVILIDFYIFYNTGTRGALLGLMAGILFSSILFAFFEKNNKKLKYAGYIVLISIIIASGTLFSIRDSEFVKTSPLLSRFSALIAAPTDIGHYISTEGRARFSIWKIAFQGVKENPILGWGQENFNYVFNEYYDPKIYDQEQWFDRAHNVFFDWLISGGIIGLLSYLSMFVFGVYTLWKNKREDVTHHFSFADKTILTALLLAYFIHNFFVFDSITSYILFFTLLAFISIHEKPISLSKILQFNFLKGESAKALASTAFVLASIIGIYILVICPWITSTSLIGALQYKNTAFSNQPGLTLDQRNTILEKSLEFFKKSFKYGKFVGSAEAYEQLNQAGLSVATTPGFDSNLVKNFSEEIDNQSKAQLARTPEDARYFLFYGVYLSGVGRYEESFPFFKKAEELSPNKQSIIIAEGLAYINAKKTEEGLAHLKKAFELDQSNNEARMLYATGYVYAGDNKKAEELLLPIKETDLGTDIRLMRAYYDTKQLAKIDELLNIKLKIAEKLWREGNKDAAIKVIQDVIAINPAFKAQGDALITQISGK